MKQCSKCLDEKEEEEFNFSATHKFHLQSFCKKCQSDYAAEYVPANKEKFKQTMQEWRAKNPKAAQVELLRKAITRLLKSGGDKPHKKLKYSGDQLREHIGTGGFDFVKSPYDFNLFTEFDKAGALENLKAI